MSQPLNELPGLDALSAQDRDIIKAQLDSPEAVNRLLANPDDLDKAQAEASLHAFIVQMWGCMDSSTFKDNWHIRVICEHLEKVANGEIKRLLINIPPRHQKSLSVSVAWPAWMWLRNPGHKFLFASYAHELSVRDSVNCRKVIQSPLYQERWGDRFRLRDDQNTKARFDNDHGGRRLATSVGGTLTGEGGNIIVIDDPISADDVRSSTGRQRTIDWWREVMATRLNDPDKGAFVIIMQRLHEADLSGYLLDNEPELWTHLCLPARYEANHPHAWAGDPRREGGELDHRSHDGLLWPSQFTEIAQSVLEKSMGAYAVAGQQQQRPVPREGGMFQRAWFEISDGVPIHARYLRYWDLAVTAPKGGSDPDWTVGLLMAEQDGVFWIADVVRFRGSPLDVENGVKHTADVDGRGTPIYIEEEGGGSGKFVIDHYQRQVLPGFAVRGDRPTAAKEVRASPFSAASESGNVKLVRARWNAEFLDEVEGAFGNGGAHDDQIDAAAAAHALLSQGEGGSINRQYTESSWHEPRVFSREPGYWKGPLFSRGSYLNDVEYNNTPPSKLPASVIERRRQEALFRNPPWARNPPWST